MWERQLRWFRPLASRSDAASNLSIDQAVDLTDGSQNRRRRKATVNSLPILRKATTLRPRRVIILLPSRATNTLHRDSIPHLSKEDTTSSPRGHRRLHKVTILPKPKAITRRRVVSILPHREVIMPRMALHLRSTISTRRHLRLASTTLRRLTSTGSPPRPMAHLRSRPLHPRDTGISHRRPSQHPRRWATARRRVSSGMVTPMPRLCARR